MKTYYKIESAKDVILSVVAESEDPLRLGEIIKKARPRLPEDVPDINVRNLVATLVAVGELRMTSDLRITIPSKQELIAYPQ